MSIDDRDDERVVTYEVSPGESLSESVVEAVSTLSDAAPTPGDGPASEPGDVLDPLYSVVDPEALDSVFRTSAADGDCSDGRVTFTYHGYEITVRSDGRIAIERADHPTPSTAD